MHVNLGPMLELKLRRGFEALQRLLGVGTVTQVVARIEAASATQSPLFFRLMLDAKVHGELRLAQLVDGLGKAQAWLDLVQLSEATSILQKHRSQIGILVAANEYADMRHASALKAFERSFKCVRMAHMGSERLVQMLKVVRGAKDLHRCSAVRQVASIMGTVRNLGEATGSVVLQKLSCVEFVLQYMLEALELCALK